MNRQKLVLATFGALAAVGAAVWAIGKASQPDLPTEPVAAGPNATYSAPDETPGTHVHTGVTTHP